MIETKLVQKFGNGGHVVLPKEYVGKRIKFLTKPKSFEDIKSEILEIIEPYSENILGIYLYGSYARNEQTTNSDIDILVIASNKLKIIDKVGDFSIISTTTNEIERLLKSNAVLILPIIKEAKTIINPNLLEKYKKLKFTRKNTKMFIDGTFKALKLNKRGFELNFEIGSLVYSLILRIRGLLMIKLMLNDKLYSKKSLFSFLENNNLKKDKIEELYRIYCSERDDIKIKESKIISKVEIEKLIVIVENLLKDVKRSLR